MKQTSSLSVRIYLTLTSAEIDLGILCTNQSQHEISNNVVCATSLVSDQPAHTRSLIRAFATRLNTLRLSSLFVCLVLNDASTLVGH